MVRLDGRETAGSQKRSYCKYIFGLLLFGSNGIVASAIALSSYEIVLLRTLLGSLLLMGIFLVRRGRPALGRHRRQLPWLAASGMADGASWIFLYEAYARIGVSIASLLYYCGPVLVMALSPLLFRERLTVWKVTGFLSVAAGAFLTGGEGLGGSGDPFGVLCGLLSAVMYAMMVICNKKASAITGLENAALQLLVSFLTVACFVGLKQGFALDIPRDSLLPILILGFLNTGIGCYFYFSSIGSLPVQTVAICGYLEPLSAVLFSVLLLRERLLPLQAAGAVMILGGAVVAECAKKPAPGK